MSIDLFCFLFTQLVFTPQNRLFKGLNELSFVLVALFIESFFCSFIGFIGCVCALSVRFHSTNQQTLHLQILAFDDFQQVDNFINDY